MRRLRQWFKAFQILLMFAAGLAAAALLFPVCDGLRTKRAIQVREWIQVAWYRGLSRVLNVRVRRLGSPAEDAALWVGNHISWLDIVVLGAECPLTFVAKSEVGDWPVVGFLARRTGTLLVRRGDPSSSRQAAESMAWLLRQRRKVMLFPEGTSGNGEEVLRFHARLFQPAVLVGGKVQSVGLAYRGEARRKAPFIGEDEFLPHLWQLLAEREIAIDLVFCEAVAADHLSRDRLAQETRLRIVEALDAGHPSPNRHHSDHSRAS